MPVIVNFFDVKIVTLIENRDYPASGIALVPPAVPEFFRDLRFSVLTVLLNIVILPLYLMPLLGMFLFYGVNGYLLGREFFMMAAKRHLPFEEADALRKQHSRLITIAGVALAVCATIPIANLFAPFWGIAVAAHLYHTLAATPPSQLLPPEKGAV